MCTARVGRGILLGQGRYSEGGTQLGMEALGCGNYSSYKALWHCVLFKILSFFGWNILAWENCAFQFKVKALKRKTMLFAMERVRNLCQKPPALSVPSDSNINQIPAPVVADLQRGVSGKRKSVGLYVLSTLRSGGSEDGGGAAVLQGSIPMALPHTQHNINVYLGSP